MTQIVQNVDLAPTHTGFETCAANAHDVAFYAGNWFAAYSTDSGNSFDALSPGDMMQFAGHTFCCDQRVEYIPPIDTFVWILLSNEGPLMLSTASPTEIENSNGRKWTFYDVTPGHFRLPNDTFDFPQISFGHHFLYLTINAIGSGGAIVARFPLHEVGDRATLHGQFIKTEQWMVCPAHNPRNAGWFGTMKSDSEIRVFTWDEDPAAWVFWFDVKISTVPTLDYSSFTPDDDDWLPPTSKIQANITGAARSRNHFWLAWSAGKKFANEEASQFPHAHIEYVIIDVPSKSLAAQRYMWNSQFAFAWPSLAANWDEDTKVAMSYCYGGGSRYPQHAVAVFGNPPFFATTSGRSAGAGGHYNDVKMCFPNTSQFVTGGFHTAKSTSSPPVLFNHPHYVVFEK